MIGDRCRWAIRVGIEDADPVPHGTRREPEHATELPAPDDPDGGGRRDDRLHQHLGGFGVATGPDPATANDSAIPIRPATAVCMVWTLQQRAATLLVVSFPRTRSAGRL